MFGWFVYSFLGKGVFLLFMGVRCFSPFRIEVEKRKRLGSFLVPPRLQTSLFNKEFPFGTRDFPPWARDFP